jgi:simple sugar transport system ATP-binding protein
MEAARGRWKRSAPCSLSPLTMRTPLLRAHNLRKQYGGVVALAGVDLELWPEEIHGLVGENGSGKSTLVKILTGVVRPDPGAEIWIQGSRFSSLTPSDALRLGIQVVHQDLSLFPNLSVAENIGIHLHLHHKFLVRWPQVRELARTVLARIGIQLPLDEPVRELSIADQQLVAIGRAIASSARLLILDEPTSSLTRRDVDRLFAVLRDLRAQGMAILFISHRLDEVLEIVDRVTVLRDGGRVGTFDRREVDRQALVRWMTGRNVVRSAPAHTTGGEVILEVVNLTKRGQFERISFTLHRGEILGLIGPRGAGRTSLALALFGLNPPDFGEIRIRGRPTRIRSPEDAVRHGIAYVPEDRLLQGVVARQSVANNLLVTCFPQVLNHLGLIDLSRRRTLTGEAVNRFSIRTPSIEAPVQTLSGGNQQKVAIAKWLLTRPVFLILDGPTVGMDVAARETIYGLIRELAGEGVGIVLISDEVSEVLGIAHRILLMQRGRIIEVLENKDLQEQDLLSRLRSA